MAFSVSSSPWYGIGTKVNQAVNSIEAMELAGLNWKVIPKPVFLEGGLKINGYVANTKDTDNKVLGIVSEQYKIIQNEEAFNFTDNLVSAGVEYDSAGSILRDRKVWLSAKLSESVIMGQTVENYLIFTNAHDGKGSIRIAIIPISKQYKNPLNLPLAGADRSWSAIHSGDMQKKMEQAKETLTFSQTYLSELVLETERLADTKVTPKQRAAFIEKLFPVNPEDGDKRIENIMELRNSLLNIINENQDYKGTQWELVTAVSIMVANMEPRRQTSTFHESKFNNIISGSYLLDRAYSILKSKH